MFVCEHLCVCVRVCVLVCELLNVCASLCIWNNEIKVFI